jgi:hypothetical protein
MKTTMAALAFALTAATTASAQSVTSAELQRLQDEIYQAGTEVSRLRTSNATEAGRLQDELDDLREESIYLKVKLRKEGSVERREYTAVRNQLQDLRSRARGDAPSTAARSGSGSNTVASGSSAPPPPPPAPPPVFDDRPRTTASSPPSDPAPSNRSRIPVGQEIDVRIQSELTSDTAQVEDRFEGTTLVDLSQGDRVLIPAGSVMRGIVTSVNRASRTDRKGSLTVAFNQVTVNGRNYAMRGTVIDTIESSGIRGEAGRIGAGSAVGAIIGGIIGGVKGALIGVLVGGGGTMVATEGKDVHLPPGTVLRVRMDTPPEITQ